MVRKSNWSVFEYTELNQFFKMAGVTTVLGVAWSLVDVFTTQCSLCSTRDIGPNSLTNHEAAHKRDIRPWKEMIWKMLN